MNGRDYNISLYIILRYMIIDTSNIVKNKVATVVHSVIVTTLTLVGQMDL